MKFPKIQLLLIVSILIITVGCGGPEERKAKYRARAQDYIQQGNFPKARVALRNVLKIDPKDPEAYYLFAEVEEKEKNWRNAFANYQRVVELVPDHDRALIKLGKFYLEARATDKVLETANKVLMQQPGHAQAEALKIAVQAINGKLNEATIQAEALYKNHSTEVDAALLLVTLYSAQQRLDEVEPILRRAIDEHPQDLALLNSLAMHYSKVGDIPRAEQTFKQIVEAEPKTFDHRMRLAGFYDQQKDYDKAEAVLREAIRSDPDNAQRRLALADYLLNRRGVQAAEAALLDAVRSLPRATTIQFALGALYERSSQLPMARQIYEAVKEENRSKPVALEAKVKLAALDLAEGKQADAERQLHEILRDNPRSADALILQGKLAMTRGDGKEATQAFRTVLKDQPESAEAHALLGQAHLVLGETNLARENLERALALNPGLTDVQVALANLDSSTGRIKEARLRLEEAFKQDPTNLGTLGLLLNMQAADRDWGATEQTMSRLRAAGANQAVTDLTEGYLYQARQDWDKAIAAFARALAVNPDAAEPLFALVRIETRLGKLAQAQSRLDATLRRNPKHPYAHGLLGELHLLKGDRSAAETSFQMATLLEPKWSTPWLNLATMKFSLKQTAEARSILTKAIAANPQSEELRMLLASSLGDAGQVDQAIKEYDSILRANPRAMLAANNLAALLIDQKGDPQSLERALTLSRDFEKTAPNPFFLDTLGWVHLKMGHRDEALRVMKEAIAKAPDHPVLNYHLGIAYHKAGHAKEAKAFLEKAVASGHAFPGVEDARTVLAELKG